jgi:hypothetical protein
MGGSAGPGAAVRVRVPCRPEHRITASSAGKVPATATRLRASARRRCAKRAAALTRKQWGGRALRRQPRPGRRREAGRGSPYQDQPARERYGAGSRTNPVLTRKLGGHGCRVNTAMLTGQQENTPSDRDFAAQMGCTGTPNGIRTRKLYVPDLRERRKRGMNALFASSCVRLDLPRPGPVLTRQHGPPRRCSRNTARCDGLAIAALGG